MGLSPCQEGHIRWANNETFELHVQAEAIILMKAQTFSNVTLTDVLLYVRAGNNELYIIWYAPG